MNDLFSYNAWANERMLTDARKATAEELSRDLKTSFGSLIGTIAHIFWAEWLWMRRLLGESPKMPFDASEYTSLDEIVRRWRDVQAEQMRFVPTADPEKKITYENYRGEHWTYSVRQIIQHTVNHSTYHRGQVVTLLRQLGHRAQMTDLLVWVDEGMPVAPR